MSGFQRPAGNYPFDLTEFFCALTMAHILRSLICSTPSSRRRVMKTMQKGLTLVEIAIMLVIIGLLLGGILKGQEMITQAKIKNAIADFSGVSAAYFGYQDRYRATPGDDGGATRWGAAVIAGNND